MMDQLHSEAYEHDLGVFEIDMEQIELNLLRQHRILSKRWHLTNTELALVTGAASAIFFILGIFIAVNALVRL